MIREIKSSERNIIKIQIAKRSLENMYTIHDHDPKGEVDQKGEETQGSQLRRRKKSTTQNKRPLIT